MTELAHTVNGFNCLVGAFVRYKPAQEYKIGIALNGWVNVKIVGPVRVLYYCCCRPAGFFDGVAHGNHPGTSSQPPGCFYFVAQGGLAICPGYPCIDNGYRWPFYNNPRPAKPEAGIVFKNQISPSMRAQQLPDAGVPCYPVWEYPVCIVCRPGKQVYVMPCCCKCSSQQF